MTDIDEAVQTLTVLERMTRVFSEEKARGWLDAGRVVVDGQVVTDPAHPCPEGQDGSRWYLSGA